jgi:hypothetical protein
MEVEKALKRDARNAGVPMCIELIRQQAQAPADRVPAEGRATAKGAVPEEEWAAEGSETLNPLFFFRQEASALIGLITYQRHHFIIDLRAPSVSLK